jgi:hypothetical protein
MRRYPLRLRGCAELDDRHDAPRFYPIGRRWHARHHRSQRPALPGIVLSLDDRPAQRLERPGSNPTLGLLERAAAALGKRLVLGLSSSDRSALLASRHGSISAASAQRRARIGVAARSEGHRPQSARLRPGPASWSTGNSAQCNSTLIFSLTHPGGRNVEDSLILIADASARLPDPISAHLAVMSSIIGRPIQNNATPSSVSFYVNIRGSPKRTRTP